MEKQQVIELIEQMREDFQFCMDCPEGMLKKMLLDRNCILGFCNWMDGYDDNYIRQFVMHELNVERFATIRFGIDQTDYDYWYPTPSRLINSAWYVEDTFGFSNESKLEREIKSDCLQPRIDHLNRTLLRLKSEAKIPQL